jgi:electron transfer flavoprotein alpha subunit
VLVVDDAAYEHALAEPLAALIVSLAAPYDAIVAAATTSGKNFMPARCWMAPEMPTAM